MALLPSGGSRVDLANRYGQYAHAHVTGTRLSYAYDPAKGKQLLTEAGYTREEAS